MKVIIVDDEPIERKAMIKFFSENYKQLEIVGEAENGRVAIELANKYKPDMITMDINMPGVNGLEAVRIIKKELPAVKFILVSAYDSFDYAKEAMQQGIKEYILKPSKKEDTIEVINRVIEEILQEKQASLLLIEQELEGKKLRQQHILSMIIQNEITKETEELFEKTFPQANSGFFHIYMNSEKEELLDILQKQKQFEYIIKKYEDKWIVLFLSEKKSIHHMKADSITLARNTYQAVHALLIGVGYPYSELTKLPISYQQALLALSQRSKNLHTPYGYPITNEKEDESAVNDFESFLSNSIQAGKIEESIYHFNLFFDYYYKKEEKSALSMVKEWGMKMKQTLESQGSYLRDLAVMEASSQVDLIELIRHFCERVILQKEGNELISKAKKYIHDHYSASLSLEDVAEHVGLTPTYFTRVFKDHTHKTFIDYVTRYRIDRAKKLLRETDLTLKEISYEIGYKDPNYFSRVFKKMADYSPKEYRKKF